MHFLRSVVLSVPIAALVGCTTTGMSVGTPEEEIIAPGITTTELQARLGEPTRRIELNPPIRAWDIPRQFPRVTLLVTSKFTRQADGKYVQELPPNIAVDERDYRFVGRLKRKSDTGESMSLALMTLGVSEILLAPAALAAKANEQSYVLTVWAGANGEALAYRWAYLKPKPEPPR